MSNSIYLVIPALLLMFLIFKQIYTYRLGKGKSRKAMVYRVLR